MERPAEAAITLTEAAYDLQVAEEDWFPKVIDAAAVLIDHGLGVAGLSGTKPEGKGPMQVEELHVATGPADFPIRLMRAMAELPSDSVRQSPSPESGCSRSSTPNNHRFSTLGGVTSTTPRTVSASPRWTPTDAASTSSPPYLTRPA